MTTKKNILLVGTGDGAIGGSERILCSLSRSLAEKGACVRMVFPKTPKSENLQAWYCAQGADAQDVPDVLCMADPHSWRDAVTLARFLRKSKADIVNLHYGGSYISLKDVLAVRFSGRKTCIATINHPVPRHQIGRQKWRMTQLAARFCHKVVTISRANQAVLRAMGIPARKIQMIPCGVPSPQILPTQAEARARLGLPQDVFMVGCLARLQPHKRITDLIDAVARISDAGKPMTLAIAGEGEERSALDRQADAQLKDRSVFLGQVGDQNDFYAACDIFALPSEMEGFGLVYVEAAFHEVPSIGTQIGGIPDAIVHGETGLLVPVGDIPALTNAIEELRNNPERRARMGAAARRRAHDCFTEQVMADRYLELLKSC